MPPSRRPTWLSALGAVLGILALSVPAAANGVGGSGISQVLPPPPVSGQELADIVDDVTAKMARSEDGPSAGTEDAYPAPADPTDFDSLTPDPDGYGIPPSAAQFRTTGSTEGGDPASAGAAYSIPPPAPGEHAAGAVPDGLERFYSQELTWESCADYNGPAGLECTYVIAPMNYDAPDGDTIALALSRAAATDDPAEGSILLGPGGPGIGGIGLAGADRFAELNETFTIVGFDPRGVGASLPNIRCQSSDAWDRQRQGADALTGEDLEAILRHNTAMCYRHSGPEFGMEDFLDHVGAVTTAKDLDLVRSALGEEELNFLGSEAALGYEYSRQFPNNIRALVLDGVGDTHGAPPEGAPASVPGATGPAQAAAWQEKFDLFLRWCTHLGEECALTGEGGAGGPSALQQRYQELARDSWGGQTYAAADGRAISFADFTNATVMALHAHELWPALNRGLAEIQIAPTADRWLMLLADHYAGRGENGSYPLARAAFPAISCHNSEPGNGADAQAQLRENFLTAAPFLDPRTEEHPDRWMGPRPDPCAYYEETGPGPGTEPLQALANTLTIAATDSPSTPFQAGVATADVLGGTLLIAAGDSPTSYGHAACATSTTNEYFHTLRVPTSFTGEDGVATRDAAAAEITGDECTVTSQFRAEAGLTSGAGMPGDTLTLDVDGLVRATEYVVTWKYGSLPLASNSSGESSLTLPIPADAEPGMYKLVLAPGIQGQNDPAIYAEASVTVRAG